MHLSDFSKKNHRVGLGLSASQRVGGHAEAAGGVRGGKLPRSSEEFGLDYFERFAPDVNVGCGGLNSLRATAAPLLESDVRGAASLASFRHDFRRLLAQFRRFSSPDAAEIHGNPIRQAKFRGFA